MQTKALNKINCKTQVIVLTWHNLSQEMLFLSAGQNVCLKTSNLYLTYPWLFAWMKTETDRQPDKNTDMHVGKQTDRWADRQTSYLAGLDRMGYDKGGQAG